VLCAGVTAYKAVLNTNIKVGQCMIVPGAGGGWDTLTFNMVSVGRGSRGRTALVRR
jgi:D-arabinose 1-dehydrogenase-like Zn-dependent alcohol dehydrogenase